MADVHVIDLGFQGLRHAVAAFLVRGPRGAVLVETGPASTTDALAAGLSEHGIAVEEIAGALVTHIHLDHAGAAGWLASHGVPIYVHPRGERHLADPSRLLESAGEIYGDRLEPLWGRTRPVARDQLRAVQDGGEVELAGVTFTAIETPGHARHHHAWGLQDILFVGDVGGVRLPTADLIAVPAVPPEFDPDTWLTSIARLQDVGASAMYLTHFGPVRDVAEHLDRLREELAAIVDFVRCARDSGVDREGLVAATQDWNRARIRAAGASDAQLERFEVANPFELSVDGVLGWLSRSDPSASSSGSDGAV